MNTQRVTVALLSSLAMTGFGVAAASSADPAPSAQSSCDALNAAAHDSAANMDKIHSIAQTISPALPHPDNQDQQTGNVNIIQLFFQAHDLSGSLRHSSSELRAAENNVDLQDLRDSADNLAQVNDDTATSFDNASNPLGPRAPMDQMASGMFDTVKNAIQSFQGFNGLYSKYCGEDLMPNYDAQPSTADISDQAPADDNAPADPAPPADNQAPADDQASAGDTGN